MRPSTVAEVAARVAAWHNRHPLARRITPAQVQGVGVVAMPFVVPAPASTNEQRRTSEPTLFESPEAPADAASASPSPPAEEAAPPAPSLRERAQAAAAGDDAAAALAIRPATLASDPPVAAPRTLLAKLRTWASGLRPAARRGFSEDFIDPLTPRRIARFALRHGSLAAPPLAAGPVRQVLEDDGLCAKGSVQTWHLRTAAIEVGSRRVRVLLGEGPDAAVIGPRLWSPARMASSAVAWVLAMTGLIAAQTLSRHSADSPSEVAVQSAPAASASAGHGAEAGTAAAAASHPGSGDAAVVTRAEAAIVLPQAGEVPASGASAATHAPVPALAAVSASAPAAHLADATAHARSGSNHDTGPTAGASSAAAAAPASSPPAATATVVTTAPSAAPGWPVNIKPVIDVETARAAKREAAAMRAQAKGGTVADAGMPGADGTAPGRAEAAVPADGTTYALAARSTRNRAASELLLGLMKTAAAASGDKSQRTEVMPAQQGWRAIWWPFRTRQDAEKAQALLVNVGLEAELVEF